MNLYIEIAIKFIYSRASQINRNAKNARWLKFILLNVFALNNQDLTQSNYKSISP